MEWLPTLFATRCSDRSAACSTARWWTTGPSRGSWSPRPLAVPAASSEPVGPMALHVDLRAGSPAAITQLRVLQTGGDDTARWRRYYDMMASGWTGSLAALKNYLERQRSQAAAVSRDRPRAARMTSSCSASSASRDIILMNVVAVVGLRWITRGARVGRAGGDAVDPRVGDVLRAARGQPCRAVEALSRARRHLRLVAARVRTVPRRHLRLVPVGQQPVLLPVRAAVRGGKRRGDVRPGSPRRWPTTRWFSMVFVLGVLWALVVVNIRGYGADAGCRTSAAYRHLDAGGAGDRGGRRSLGCSDRPPRSRRRARAA